MYTYLTKSKKAQYVRVDSRKRWREKRYHETKHLKDVTYDRLIKLLEEQKSSSHELTLSSPIEY